nr:hypothetical protein [Mycoplasmopsis bovis]
MQSSNDELVSKFIDDFGLTKLLSSKGHIRFMMQKSYLSQFLNLVIQKVH